MTAGVNRTIPNIIKESVLINTFRNTYLTLDKNLQLNYISTRHSDPDMTDPLGALRRDMRSRRPHEFQPGAARKAKYHIPDLTNTGLERLATGQSGADADAEGGGDGEDGFIQTEAEDLGVDTDM